MLALPKSEKTISEIPTKVVTEVMKDLESPADLS